MPSGGVRISGRLEEVTLPGLLQMLAVKGKTGKLALTCRGGSGLVVLREGHIIYAASNSAREALGNILVCQSLIDEPTLMRALELQHTSSEEKRLGAILVEMGALSREALEEVMRQQTTRIIRDLFEWERGFFAFDPLDIAEHGEVSVDAADLVMESGLNAGEVARDSIDPAGFETQPVTYKREPSPDGAGGAAGAMAHTSLASLKSIMAELRAPEFGGEITLWLLRYASGIVKRSVLFSISREGIRGMGQVGLDPDGAGSGERLRRLRLPPDEPSVFRGIVEGRGCYVGPMAHEPWNEHLAEQLGGGFPKEVAAVPMVVNGNAIAVLYGDNLPESRPIGPVDALEMLMLEAGLAMEKTALEMRLRTLQERLGSH